jgi:hypothetical protein
MNQAEAAAAMGAFEVIEGEQKDQRYFWVSFSHYEVQGDKVLRVYSNVAKPQDQLDAIAASNVRAQRDQLLTATDWRVIKALEAGQPQDFGWAVYRQALRDVTAQDGFPHAVVWPNDPNWVPPVVTP